MNKKRAIVVAAVTLFVFLAAAYLWSPGAAPAGQKPLVTLSKINISEFEKAFDAKAEVPRMLLLLSPT